MFRKSGKWNVAFLETAGEMARGDGGEAARCMRAHMLNASGALTSYIKMLNDTDPPE